MKKFITPLIFNIFLLAVLGTVSGFARSGCYEDVPSDTLNKYILTPATPDTPQINGPKIFGVRPGSPFLYLIPATGRRPLTFSASHLPSGLKINKTTGQITGTLSKKGKYKVTLHAKNQLGKTRREFTIVVGETIALTPPMGWNSWNAFGINIDDDKIRSAAEALVETGLANYGWNYIIADGGWTVAPENPDTLLNGIAPYDSEGKINANRKFPDMKALSDFIHSKGLKFGLHTSPGPITCSPLGFTACYNHERECAKRFYEWDLDFIKYDWCSYTTIAKDNSMPELQKPFLLMRGILDPINRDIVFSINPGPAGRKSDPWKWGEEVGANMWRTTGDINDSWKSVSRISFSQRYGEYAQPGHWNDPDMLTVGYVGWNNGIHYTRLTPDEQYTHVSLWCLLSAPLFIGCDLGKMDAFTFSLLTNTEVLDVDQDPACHPVKVASEKDDRLVYSKLLEDGSLAVGLFNKGDEKATVSANWADLGLSGKQTVRDLWRQKDVGVFEGEFAKEVAPRGVVFVKIKPMH